MSTITAAAVNELRRRTDLPMMECKKALTETAGDMDKAIDLLRSQFAKATVKREGNETAEGRVGVFMQGEVAAIVELRCESAPTAKNDRTGELVADVAKHIVAHNAADVPALMAQPFGAGTVQDRLNEVVGVIREKMVIHRFARLTGGVFGSYVHHDGTLGVLLQCTGTPSGTEPLRDICAHIAALNPQFMVTAEVPADLLAKEKEIAMKQIQEDPKNAGKPANIIEMIAAGKLKTWMAESVLMEQPMANAQKYPNQTVGQVLTKLGLKPEKVIRYKVGAVSA